MFKRNKVPFDVKILGIATYVQTSSLLCSDVFSRENCQNSLSEFHPVSIDLSLGQIGLKRDCLLYQRRREDT